MADFQVVNALDKRMRESDDVRSLLLTHLRTPDKVDIYYDALRKCLEGNRLVFTATWSWWAFFGGAFYFFYRRMTRPGLLLLIPTVVLCFVPIPMVGFLVNVGCGVAAKYLYCKKFIGDLDIAGYPDRSPEEMHRSLARLGGYNSWAIWVAVLWYTLSLIVTIVLVGAVLGAIGLFSVLSGLG